MSNYLCGRLCTTVIGLAALSGCVAAPERIGYHEDMQVDTPECRGDNNCAVLLSENIKAVNPKLLLKVLGEIDAVVMTEQPLYVHAIRRTHTHLLSANEGGETLTIQMEEITDERTFVTILTQRVLGSADNWSKVVADRLAEEAMDHK